MRVGLFVTCLVDLMRPSIGLAALKLLEDAGYEVTVPAAQTCCGQPGWNSGDRKGARALAERVISQFEECRYVVVPSGSCAGMIRAHFPEVFASEPAMLAKARRLAARTYELTEFLTKIAKRASVSATFDGAVTYHDSCSGLRELGVKAQPRQLLGSVQGLELKEMHDADVCCGFGGTFCVKYPDISNTIVTKKAEHVAATGADTLLAGDLGCLMNMAGKLQRLGKPIHARHIAEVLAGVTEPPIGER